MPEQSKDQIEEVLSRLTTKKLKELSRRYGLDTTKCKKKSECISLMLESDMLSDIMADEEFFEKEVKELDAIETEIVEVGKEIEKDITEARGLPRVANEEADALISQNRDFDMSFDELEDVLEEIRMRYEERNYLETLNYYSEAKRLTNGKLKELERYLWTYTILSSQKIIEDCGKAGGEIDNAARLLIGAKDSYKSDDILDNKDLIEDLRSEARKLLETEVGKARKNLLAKEEYVANLKNLGANIAASEELLRRAWEVIERNDHLRCTEYANKAHEIAEESREKRLNEIKNAIPQAQKLIEEAKQLGSDVTEAEKLLKQAEVALGNRDYLLASELTKRAEQKTVELQDTQIQKAMELRQKQMESISRSIAYVEPLVMEAEMYGLNVMEARDLLQRTKVALDAQDYVNGTLFIKNAEEIVKNLEPEMENYRSKSEMPKPTGGICSRCESPNLKFFDNGWGKCSSCGNTFRWMAEKPAEKEKKGIFGKLFKK